MLLSSTEAREILTRALGYATADETEVTLRGHVEGNIRFAQNVPTTAGSTSGLTLQVTCSFGMRSGSFNTSQIDDESMREAVARAEELARLAPENPEHMPLLEQQRYLDVVEWDDLTAGVTPEDRARIASQTIGAAAARELMSAGYYEDGYGFYALANSKGLFAYHRSTNASYTLTVRTSDGTGSGWSARESFAIANVDGAHVTHRAIEKAVASHAPVSIEPGTYNVVLEPSAAGDMVSMFYNNLSRRSADEGRSFFSDPEKGTKLGEKLFDEKITIYSDPTNPIVPSLPWGEAGMALKHVEWVDKGVQRNLATSRYWGKEKGVEPVGGNNIIMEGGDHSLDDLVAATEYGLLVTSMWYIRAVDPRSILYTGLTRDGLFLIEKGRVSRPVVNFRWNESPAALFRCIEMLSRPERAVTREGYLPILVPAIKAREFRFTSVSPST